MQDVQQVHVPLFEESLQAEGHVHIARRQFRLGIARRAKQFDDIVRIVPMDDHLSLLIDHESLARAEGHEVFRIQLKASIP